MAKIKSFFKELIPTVLISLLKNRKSHSNGNGIQEVWSGDFASWADAMNQCSGYDSPAILEKSKNSLLKVKSGEAIYERDSVLFDEIQYSWGLLAGLQNAALENKGKLCVLDFGGSLGSTYYQNRKFLNTVNDLKWCIVEQEKYIASGKEFFEDQHLKFYYTIEECIKECKPDVLLLSGVLQYLENPYACIQNFISTGVKYIILDRTSFADTVDDILTVQNVPKEIYQASYPSWFFNESKLLESFNGYTSIGKFDSYCDGPIKLNSLYRATWKGAILKQL